MVRVSASMIDVYFNLIYCRNIEEDPVLTLVAIEGVAEVDWEVLSNCEWFPYDYLQRILVLRPEGGATGSQNVGKGKIDRKIQPMACPVYRTGYTTRGMSLVFAHETWHQYLVNNVHSFVLSNLEVGDDLTILLQVFESAVVEVCLVRVMKWSSRCLLLMSMTIGN